MSSIEFVTIEVADTTAGNRFYTAALDLGTRVRLRASEAPTTGFRGFTLSLIVSQPATVNGPIGAALDAGATSLKPAAKSLWGYGGVVQAPDGTIWTACGRRKIGFERPSEGRRRWSSGQAFAPNQYKRCAICSRALLKAVGVARARPARPRSADTQPEFSRASPDATAEASQA
jgi:hypothetical protein